MRAERFVALMTARLIKMLRWIKRSTRKAVLPLASVMLLYILAMIAVAVVCVMQDPYEPRAFNDPVEQLIQGDYIEHKANDSDDAFVAVTLHIRGIDGDSYTGKVVVTVRFVGAHLVDKAGKRLGAMNGMLVGTSVEAPSDIAVTVITSTTQGTVATEIPLAAFDAATATASVTAELPITGFPQGFPADHYDLWAISWVRLPEGVLVSRPPLLNSIAELETHTYYKIGPGLSYWRARTNSGANMSADPRLLHQPGLELHRPGRYLGFIWAVCTVPPALLGLYFILAMAGFARQSTSHFELGIATLALIALRQFFAPNVAVGISTLDHFLAIVLAVSILLSALVATVQAVSDENETSPPQSSQADTSTNIHMVPASELATPASTGSARGTELLRKRIEIFRSRANRQ